MTFPAVSTDLHVWTLLNMVLILCSWAYNARKHRVASEERFALKAQVGEGVEQVRIGKTYAAEAANTLASATPALNNAAAVVVGEEIKKGLAEVAEAVSKMPEKVVEVQKSAAAGDSGHGLYAVVPVLPS